MNRVINSNFAAKAKIFFSDLIEVIPSLLPFIALFLMIPLAIYLPNQSEFNFNAGVLAPFLALFAVCCLLTLPFLFRSKEPVRTKITAALFFIGFYILLSDILAPVQLGELIGGEEQKLITEPLSLTIVEIALALTMLAAAVWIPFEKIRRFAVILVLFLLVAQGASVAWKLSPESSFFSIGGKLELVPEPSVRSTGGNIYHLTFDAYSNTIFLDALDQLGIKDEFTGFYFFENNRSNYLHTSVSVPSYMTGSLYKEGSSLKDWRQNHRSSGIVKKLYDDGYTVSSYVQDTSWRSEKTSYITTNQALMTRHQQGAYMSQFADLWLLRSVPNFLQNEVYSEGQGIFTRLTKQKGIPGGEDQRSYSSYLLVRQLIKDEASRPARGQYVYGHIYIPHGPYVLDRNCGIAEKRDYREQAFCAASLMADFISELKRLGRYNDATILFHSDHATWEISPGKKDESAMPPEIKQQIESVSLRRVSADYIDNQSRSLFFIKPAGRSSEPLVVSPLRTQLLDIPASLYDSASLTQETTMGNSVFSLKEEQEREIHIYMGYKQQDADGNTKVIGKDIEKGEMNHFAVGSDGKWKVYPNIEATWESSNNR